MSPILKNINDLSGAKSVSFYGAGSLGAYSIKKIKELRKDLRLDYFIDDKKTGEFEGLPLTSFSEYCKKPSDLTLITSSYWRDISKKTIEANINYAVLDLLSGEHSPGITEKKLKGRAARFSTPNNFLFEVVNNLEIIEPKTIEWIDNFPADAVFYDIGASCGIYALYGAITTQCAAVTFEPDAQNHAILQQNNYLNSQLIRNNITALNIGLGEKPGILPLVCQEYLSGSHGKIFQSGNRAAQDSMEASFLQNTLCDSLDNIVEHYNLPLPHYVKIDVDGFEINILKGALNTFSRKELKEVLIESSAPLLQTIKEILEPKGFTLKETQSINEITGFPVAGVYNYLFVRA